MWHQSHHFLSKQNSLLLFSNLLCLSISLYTLLSFQMVLPPSSFPLSLFPLNGFPTRSFLAAFHASILGLDSGRSAEERGLRCNVITALFVSRDRKAARFVEPPSVALQTAHPQISMPACSTRPAWPRWHSWPHGYLQTNHHVQD